MLFRSAKVAKEAISTGNSLRELLLEKKIIDEATLDKILEPFGMTTPGISAEELLKA